MSVNVNSASNTITVIPDRNIRIMSNLDTVEYKFEFTLPDEQILEINELFGTEITNNVITGANSDYIIDVYIIPLIQSSDINSLIFEIFNHFSS
jgi:hypothetical protein